MLTAVCINCINHAVYTYIYIYVCICAYPSKGHIGNSSGHCYSKMRLLKLLTIVVASKAVIIVSPKRNGSTNKNGRRVLRGTLA